MLPKPPPAANNEDDAGAAVIPGYALILDVGFPNNEDGCCWKALDVGDTIEPLPNNDDPPTPDIGCIGCADWEPNKDFGVTVPPIVVPLACIGFTLKPPPKPDPVPIPNNDPLPVLVLGLAAVIKEVELDLEISRVCGLCNPLAATLVVDQEVPMVLRAPAADPISELANPEKEGDLAPEALFANKLLAALFFENKLDGVLPPLLPPLFPNNEGAWTDAVDATGCSEVVMPYFLRIFSSIKPSLPSYSFRFFGSAVSLSGAN